MEEAYRDHYEGRPMINAFQALLKELAASDMPTSAAFVKSLFAMRKD